ncbi:phospholipase A2 inhibitor and Ly6/PLAUR domain-containing protein-like [Rana temporaria]|uniref:phospholipase A2 inhibitor and Ly6/PLAUR domain-containing protein-like n=1 Tax=Rana temporaria TaxID=8407 RepID=UPI001AAC572F|nr:phospholipase A2 inhibitor and Ly6/PLAUR domain-containing protein-like [Rana temporaria]
MAMTLAALLVLYALIPSGFSISCIKCIDLRGNYCSGETVTCPSGYSCATALTESTLTSPGVTGMSIFARGCVPNNQCEKTGSVTSTDANVRTATLCCDYDNCETRVPTLPEPSFVPNGLTCSSCSTISSDDCRPSSTLQCTGSETKCGRLSSSIGGHLSSFLGCATPSVCDLLGNQQTTFASGVGVRLRTTCTNGGFYHHGSFYLSPLIFLLLKVLL